MPRTVASGREIAELQLSVSELLKGQMDMQIGVAKDQAAAEALLGHSGDSLKNFSEPISTALTMIQEMQNHSQITLENASKDVQNAADNLQQVLVQMNAFNKTLDNVQAAVNGMSTKLPLVNPHASRKRP